MTLFHCRFSSVQLYLLVSVATGSDASKGLCYTLEAGASESNSKVLALPSASYICPSKVDQTNWQSQDSFRDTFSISQKGTDVTITRSDADEGWGMILSFLCCKVPGTVFFEESFDSLDWESRWVHSTWHGANGPAGKFHWSPGKWFVDEEANKGIRTASDSHYHGISAKLPKAFSNRGRDLVVQFTVKHEDQDFSFCAGGYIKLMGSDIDQESFGGDTPYKIMFGPDVCDYDVSRIQLIFNWKGKNLVRTSDITLTYDERDEFTHLYTLVLKPDNSYKVYIDLKEKSSGNLHHHWEYPKMTRDDPTDKKPEDFTTVRRIVDASAKKPSYWIDEQMMPDPAAFKPLEWDDEEDGDFQPPMVQNPAYKGPWIAPRIDNPEYRGEWRPRQIGNPDYEEEVYSYSDIGAVGFELWTVDSGSVFDNILICDSWEHAKQKGAKIKDLLSRERQALKRWKDKSSDTAAGPSDAAPAPASAEVPEAVLEAGAGISAEEFLGGATGDQASFESAELKMEL